MASDRAERESRRNSVMLVQNVGSALLPSTSVFFTHALARTREIKNCVEFGANGEKKLRALTLLFPKHQHFASA